MDRKWFILADDLTGAAECAVAFSRRGMPATVSWGDAADITNGPISVVSYDANSRGLTADAAAQKHTDILARLLTPDQTLFKKIDSTLRGQPAAETAAAIAHLRHKSGSAFGVLALAFPATGRTTIDGRVLVGGRPLEQAEVWQRDHTYANADIKEVLASAGVQASKVPLSTVRDGTLLAVLTTIAAENDCIAICDAETEHDLDRIARAGLSVTPPAYFIGSAGLAHALAAASASKAVAPIQIAPNERGTLIVVGSLAGASRGGARKLVESGAVTHLPVTPQTLLGENDDKRAFTTTVVNGLADGGDLLVEIVMDDDPDMSLGPRLAERLADALAPAACEIGALAATGGETAATLLSRLGVNGIRLADEVEPGVSLGVTLGSLSIPIATKAGAFGDENSLIRMTERLRSARIKGKLT